MTDDDTRDADDDSFVDLLAGFSLGGRRSRRSRPELVYDPDPPVTGTPRHARPVDPLDVFEPPEPEPELAEADVPRLVRPYSWTRGRTKSNHELRIETLISTTSHGREDDSRTAPEHRTIAGMCGQPRSVAEVAVHMAVPLGVARVMLSDMADLGLVVIHRSETTGDEHFVLMERVLSGLRRL